MVCGTYYLNTTPIIFRTLTTFDFLFCSWTILCFTELCLWSRITFYQMPNTEELTSNRLTTFFERGFTWSWEQSACFFYFFFLYIFCFVLVGHVDQMLRYQITFSVRAWPVFTLATIAESLCLYTSDEEFFFF